MNSNDVRLKLITFNVQYTDARQLDVYEEELLVPKGADFATVIKKPKSHLVTLTFVTSETLTEYEKRKFAIVREHVSFPARWDTYMFRGAFIDDIRDQVYAVYQINEGK